jgi:FtsZ-interacting cell division protein ZipA
MNSNMDTSVLILVVVVLLVAIVVAGLYVGRQRRTQRLRERFGPEYDRTVSEKGGRQEAESELASRERRHRKLDLRPLDPDAADRYRSEWRQTQSDFVDSPSTAIHDADRLITRVMRDRGYPMDNFDQRSDDLSVDHPEVVNDYRYAHRVSVAHREGAATTEQLREAMVRYRALFDRLISTDDESAKETRR